MATAFIPPDQGQKGRVCEPKSLEMVWIAGGIGEWPQKFPEIAATNRGKVSESENLLQILDVGFS